ncbi:hypothetical protein C7N43_07475 [Sphingobacteriales bacterium UPWRP_1]|nr:hypothetical protein B6N25_05320 [Sphingobacteriales bacterium TSM_CSS]PSJ77712.1 hypothetical protein C7N43_07475 [Sphingobacteriales bacterium UPWRP_1]
MKCFPGIAFSLFFLISQLVVAQGQIIGCSYDGSVVNTDNLCRSLKFASNSDAESSIDDMLRQIGLKRNFAIMECPGTENCMAVTIEGIRFIIYDNAFLSKFKTYRFSEAPLIGGSSSTTADWAAISIMAHEVGHHLNGHTLQAGGSKPDLELEADEFSGFILYKLGATLEQAQQAMRSPLISDYGTFTHPPRQQRLNAIATGWNNARNLTAPPDLPPLFDQPNLPEMVYIEGGSFNMGYNSLLSLDEGPVHPVTLDGFYMAKTEVTVDQYRTFCNATSREMPFPVSWGWIDNYPIVNVSWDDANAYCVWLSTVTGQKYRLPTEAEWEYAARAGNQSTVLDYPFSGSLFIGEVGWYKDNSLEQPHPVGLKNANRFGLYDMTGNVWEWCSDWYDAAYYFSSDAKNPAGPYFGEKKVLRGGSWATPTTDCSVYDRDMGFPGLGLHFTGFRVVKEQ